MELITSNYTIKSVAMSALSGKSKNSRKMYAVAIQRWLGFLAKHRAQFMELTWETLLKADVHTAKAFLFSLKEEGLSYNTIGLYLSACRCFHDEIIHTGIGLTENIFNSQIINLPKGSRRPRHQAEALTDEQVRVLLSLPNLAKPKGIRDYAIFCCLFGIGIRRSELLNLTPECIIKKDKLIKMTIYNTKNNPKREVTLAPWVYNALQEWIKVGKIAKDKPIFKLSDQGLWKMIREYSHKLGLESTMSSHSGRATVATKLWNEDAPPAAIQEHLGHSSLRTTEGYIRGRVSKRSIGALIDYTKDN